jgi:O-antigen ligase
MREFSWGLFVVLAVSAMFVALGLPTGPVLVLAGIISLAVAFRYPYFTFYLAIALIPFLGFTISIPTGELSLGQRAFGGSIDIGVSEAVMMALLIAWAFKMLFLWVRRRDVNWKPSLPLLGSYLTLIGAHLASALSSFRPDQVLVAKFALRPVLFCYLAYIAVPVNFIRSRRKLVGALSVMTGVGMLAAVNGFFSLFFVDATSQFIRRAHPLPMLGVPVLGDNHNLLAELLCATVMMTLALVSLVKTPRMKRLLTAAAAFQFLIGLLTFSRTGWIVFAIEGLLIAVLEYRDVLRKRLSLILMAAVVLIPLGYVMATISASNVATSSNSTRLALLEIATDVFLASPLVGSGAGTFVDRVGSAYVFRLEYGQPLDAHGFLQKLAAETGLLGLLAFAFVCAMLARRAYEGLRKLPEGPIRLAAVYLTAGALGAIVYQLFNTNYWTGKMWLPIGIMLAGYRAFALADQKEHRSEPV